MIPKNFDFAFLVFFLSLLSCGSLDYGSAPIDFVTVNAANPTWELDIDPLVKMKCQNCHGEKRSSFVPSNTPPFNKNSFQTKSGFALRAVGLEARIFKDSKNPMPPNYATPLTTEETLAFKNYFKTLAASQPSLVPNATDTKNGNLIKFESVKGLYATSCAIAGGCHAVSGSVSDLSTYERISAKAAMIRGYLERNEMPKINTTGKIISNEERSLMIKWIDDGAQN